MTNNIRVFLWVAVALALWLNYSQWQMDYGPKTAAATPQTGAETGAKPPSLDDTVPQAAQPSATPAVESAMIR